MKKIRIKPVTVVMVVNGRQVRFATFVPQKQANLADYFAKARVKRKKTSKTAKARVVMFDAVEYVYEEVKE